MPDAGLGEIRSNNTSAEVPAGPNLPVKTFPLSS
jgi:hypothetical protein